MYLVHGTIQCNLPTNESLYQPYDLEPLMLCTRRVYKVLMTSDCHFFLCAPQNSHHAKTLATSSTVNLLLLFVDCVVDTSLAYWYMFEKQTHNIFIFQKQNYTIIASEF